MKTLVIFTSNKITDSIKYFCKFGYFDSDDTDFFICLNDISLDISSIITPKHNLFIINKENNGYDFGSWSYVLLNNNLYTKYDYYILINDSCIGPFLPVYEKEKWTKIFTSMIDNDNKLIGPTINYQEGSVHVQSYFLCFDRIVIDIAIKNKIFSYGICKKYNDPLIWKDIKYDFIKKYELRFSNLVLDAGYNIKCMMKGLENIDFRKNRVKEEIEFTYGITKHDMLYNNEYFDITINPIEVIFFKFNRNLNQKILDKYISFNERIADNDFDTIY